MTLIRSGQEEPSIFFAVLLLSALPSPEGKGTSLGGHRRRNVDGGQCTVTPLQRATPSSAFTLLSPFTTTNISSWKVIWGHVFVAHQPARP